MPGSYPGSGPASRPFAGETRPRPASARGCSPAGASPRDAGMRLLADENLDGDIVRALLVTDCSTDDEWEGRVLFLPLCAHRVARHRSTWCPPRRIHMRFDARALGGGGSQRATATTIDAEPLLPHSLSDAPDRRSAHRDGPLSPGAEVLPEAYCSATRGGRSGAVDEVARWTSRLALHQGCSHLERVERRRSYWRSLSRRRTVRSLRRTRRRPSTSAPSGSREVGPGAAAQP